MDSRVIFITIPLRYVHRINSQGNESAGTSFAVYTIGTAKGTPLPGFYRLTHLEPKPSFIRIYTVGWHHLGQGSDPPFDKILWFSHIFCI